MRFSVDAGPSYAAPHRSGLVDRLEVVLLEVLSDLLAEHRSLRVGGAEVDARPHSGVDNFAEHIREPLEAPRGTGFVAERADGDLVGAEEVLERVYERTSCAGVARWVVRKGRREEREQRVADWRRGVKQRQPRRVGLGVRVAVGVGFSDRRYRPPELPIVLVVPAADRGISRG